MVCVGFWCNEKTTTMISKVQKNVVINQHVFGDDFLSFAENLERFAWVSTRDNSTIHRVNTI